MAEAVAAVIDRTLAATRVTGSRNAITAADLREWAVAYLAEKDLEWAHFPELVGQPHWNLWMMDAELDNALFAAFVFGTAEVRVVCGTGDSFAIRSWDSDNPADPSGLEAELRRDFRVPEAGVSIGRTDAEAWLGRDW
ncbi:unnamed protein product [Gemmataceae bacterium]|nr:unnamed protein product [Gemmataceae bacterium]VTU01114.1 unnamed protein product [Gemmataceae bacterium]